MAFPPGMGAVSLLLFRTRGRMGLGAQPVHRESPAPSLRRDILRIVMSPLRSGCLPLALRRQPLLRHFCGLKGAGYLCQASCGAKRTEPNNLVNFVKDLLGRELTP